jgi:N-dimethylarginine dimethylaminohydrolase
MKQTIILGSPDYYNSESTPVDIKKAKKQWQRLKTHIESYNINVKVIHSSKNEMDRVYITDTAIIVNNFAIISRFHKYQDVEKKKALLNILKID